MARTGFSSALFTLQLLLIVGIKIEGLGADVCRGENVQNHATFLEEENVKTIENHNVGKMTMEQILLERKTQQDKIERLEITVESLKAQMLKVENIIKSSPERLNFLQRENIGAKNQCFFNEANLISAAGKQFYFNTANGSMTWFKSREWCVERGMRQASLKTLSEIQSVLPQLKQAGSWFWVSGSDIDQTPGQFRWDDGTSVDSSVWGVGFPQFYGAGKQTCTEFYTSYGKLLDNDCTSGTSLTLCEVPAALSHCLI